MRRLNLENLHVGTAGWTIPKPYADRFADRGSHLERYTSQLRAVEINSSFYRAHRPATYERWAASVPDDFRFALKLPREITHDCRFHEADECLERFLHETDALGEKRGPILVQLPPSFEFEAALVESFLEGFRGHFAGELAFEPRHPTWFNSAADELLHRYRAARVAADPPVTNCGNEPGGWPGLVYYRWHGSPRVYYSAYSADDLDRLAKALSEPLAHGVPTWCIFDNTALGEATNNALALLTQLECRVA